MKRYRHKKLSRSKLFDPRSFRTIGIPGSKRGRKMTVACLKGKWSPKKKRCRIGMRGVNLLTPKKRSRNSGGWDRFEHYGSWDYVYEAGMGDPTPAEEKAIMALGYWGKPINKETIHGLKDGRRFDMRMVSKSGLAIQADLVDGSETKVFRSKQEMKEYIEERIQPDFPFSESGFGTEYGRYSLIGATMSELGISPSRNRRTARNPGFSDIRPGDRVTIVTHHGSKLTGRVVMRSGDGRGWVLNLGGKHGTPGLAYPENTVKVSKSKTGPTYLNPRRLKMKSKRHKHKRRKKSNPELLIVNNPRHAKHKRRKRRSKKSARKILYRRKRRSLGQLVKLVGKRKAKKIWGGKKSRAHGKRKRKSSRRGRRSR